jgi:hypothetical protein
VALRKSSHRRGKDAQQSKKYEGLGLGLQLFIDRIKATVQKVVTGQDTTLRYNRNSTPQTSARRRRKEVQGGARGRELKGEGGGAKVSCGSSGKEREGRQRGLETKEGISDKGEETSTKASVNAREVGGATKPNSRTLNIKGVVIEREATANERSDGRVIWVKCAPEVSAVKGLTTHTTAATSTKATHTPEDSTTTVKGVREAKTPISAAMEFPFKGTLRGEDAPREDVGREHREREVAGRGEGFLSEVKGERNMGGAHAGSVRRAPRTVKGREKDAREDKGGAPGGSRAKKIMNRKDSRVGRGGFGNVEG